MGWWIGNVKGYIHISFNVTYSHTIYKGKDYDQHFEASSFMFVITHCYFFFFPDAQWLVWNAGENTEQEVWWPEVWHVSIHQGKIQQKTLKGILVWELIIITHGTLVKASKIANLTWWRKQLFSDLCSKGTMSLCWLFNCLILFTTA